MGRIPRQRKINVAAILAALTLFWTLGTVQLQAQAIVNLRLDSSFLETGEAFTLHLETNLYNPDTIECAAWDSILPPENRLGQTPWVKDGSTWKKDLRLILFDEADSLTLPPITVVDKSGERAYSEPLQLSVNATPVPSGEISDMADIKGIHREEKNWTDYLWILWILGGIGALTLLGYWWRKRQQAVKPTLYRQQALSAKALALKKLDQLEAQQLWQKGEIKAYYSTLSNIIRGYMDDTYGLQTHKTGAEEALRQVQHVPLSAAAQTVLAQLLRNADLAKYAKGQPDPQYHHQAMVDARQIILQPSLPEHAEPAA